MPRRSLPSVVRVSAVQPVVRFTVVVALLAACAPVQAPVSVPTPEQIPALEARLTAEPGNVDVLVPLGLAYEEAERLDEAVELYTRYIEADAYSALARHLRDRLRLIERRRLVEDVRRALAREAELSATSPVPTRVAVFPFQFAGGDPALSPLGRALAEMLVTDLSQSERLTVLERVQVQLLLDEMALADSGYVDPATAARSGRLLGAGRIVQGRIGGDQASLELQAAVVEVGGAFDGRIDPVTDRDEARRLFDMEKRLALEIFRSLGVDLTPAERERIARRPTASLEALLEYGRGLEAEDRGDFARAASLFERAAAIDPGFIQAANRASRASRTATAARVTTTQLARLGTTGEAGARGPLMEASAVAPPGGLGELDAVQFLVPGFGGRDAVSEFLGQEGLGMRTIIEVIVVRPGGSR